MGLARGWHLVSVGHMLMPPHLGQKGMWLISLWGQAADHGSLRCQVRTDGKAWRFMLLTLVPLGCTPGLWVITYG